MPMIFSIALIGLLGGLTSGLFGVGGGVVFVPLMIVLLGLEPQVAVGTSLAAIVPTALIAAIKHSSQNSHVNLKMAVMVAVFAMIGSWFGAVICQKINPALLKKLFALFLLFMSAKLFFSRS